MTVDVWPPGMLAHRSASVSLHLRIYLNKGVTPGGWTYPLYSGSLLCYNHTGNAAFVIASGAILGIGASFLWVAQGAVECLQFYQPILLCTQRFLWLDYGFLPSA